MHRIELGILAIAIFAMTAPFANAQPPGGRGGPPGAGRRMDRRLPTR